MLQLLDTLAQCRADIRQKIPALCDKVILLVGTNPLPNYVAAILLAPKTIYLVHSEQTLEISRRLQKYLQSQMQLSEENIISINIEDSASVPAIEKLSDRLPQDSSLHFTGGTKVMAALIYYIWRNKHDSKPCCASYLDDASDQLRFDNGVNIIIYDVVSVKFQTLIELHGLENVNARPYKANRMTSSAIYLLEQALQNHDIPKRLYEIVPRTYKDFQQKRDFVDTLIRFLNTQQLDAERLGVNELPSMHKDMSKAQLDKWFSINLKRYTKFLTGDWLDEFVAHTIQSILPDTTEITVGVEARNKGSQMEIDVILTRGHRLYTVSCTTSSQKHTCKSKLFEVVLRARQLGGDLARSALVCLLNYEHVEALQNELAASWGADSAHVPRIFGLPHLQEWHDGDRSSLQCWLNS